MMSKTSRDVMKRKTYPGQNLPNQIHLELNALRLLHQFLFSFAFPFSARILRQHTAHPIVNSTPPPLRVLLALQTTQLPNIHLPLNGRDFFARCFCLRRSIFTCRFSPSTFKRSSSSNTLASSCRPASMDNTSISSSPSPLGTGWTATVRSMSEIWGSNPASTASPSWRSRGSHSSSCSGWSADWNWVSSMPRRKASNPASTISPSWISRGSHPSSCSSSCSMPRRKVSNPASTRSPFCISCESQDRLQCSVSASSSSLWRVGRYSSIETKRASSSSGGGGLGVAEEREREAAVISDAVGVLALGDSKGGRGGSASPSSSSAVVGAEPEGPSSPPTGSSELEAASVVISSSAGSGAASATSAGLAAGVSETGIRRTPTAINPNAARKIAPHLSGVPV
ncbi:hypothetical protein FPV67DRAFT_1531037 [Lyophyllum atratum]|nr:hypothetical protein FPV67DRAFT_1531037 [Lyophyllum atratum]